LAGFFGALFQPKERPKRLRRTVIACAYHTTRDVLLEVIPLFPRLCYISGR